MQSLLRVILLSMKYPAPRVLASTYLLRADQYIYFILSNIREECARSNLHKGGAAETRKTKIRRKNAMSLLS